MNTHFDYLKGIRDAVEQRLGRSLSEIEFQVLLIRGDGQFWDLDWNSEGIRLYEINALKAQTS
jgi:hypothetical protein